MGINVDAKKAVDVFANILDAVDHRTASTIDDELLKFTKAVQQSPAMIEYLQSKIDSIGAGSGGDGGIFSLENPPSLEDMPEPVVLQVQSNLPEDISFGDILKFIPMIIEIIRQIIGAFGGGNIEEVPATTE